VFVFAQVLPDYVKGLLNIIPQGKISEQQFNQFAKLAALQHRAKDSLYTPTMYVSTLYSLDSLHNLICLFFHVLTFSPYMNNFWKSESKYDIIININFCILTPNF